MARMNQKDQAHAYRFLARRLSAALVSDDPDSPDAPMRRLAIASFGSVMVAALAVAGAGIYGVLRPGGDTAWKTGTSVILERQTGNRYLYLGGELHPVLNYASARLVLGQPTFAMVTVSQQSLLGTAVGQPIGIPGAPDALPTPATLTSGPWSACSLPAQDQSGAATAYVRLSVGRPATGSPLPADRGLLVTGQDGTVYLIWNDKRFTIRGGQEALAALGYASTPPLVVGAALLTVLPQGPDLVAPTVPDLGSRGPVVAGHAARVGQVFAASGGGQAGRPPQYYLALPGGLAPLSVTEADLMLADPKARGLYPPGALAAIEVPAASVAAVATLPPAGEPSLPGRPPGLRVIAGGQGAVCAVYQAGGDGSPVVRTYRVSAGQIPTRTGAAPAGALGVPLADQVRMSAGDGAVVRAVAVPGAGGGTIYLITSEGIKYPVPSAGVLTSLGLAGVSPVAVPAEVLGLLKSGPTLDPNAPALTTPFKPNRSG